MFAANIFVDIQSYEIRVNPVYSRGKSSFPSQPLSNARYTVRICTSFNPNSQLPTPHPAGRLKLVAHILRTSDNGRTIIMHAARCGNHRSLSAIALACKKIIKLCQVMMSRLCVMTTSPTCRLQPHYRYTFLLYMVRHHLPVLPPLSKARLRHTSPDQQNAVGS